MTGPPWLTRLPDRMRRLWDTLTAPHPRIQDEEDAHGARLVAAMIIVHAVSVLVVFSLLRIAMLRLLHHDIIQDLDSLVILGITALLVIPYLLLRAGYYRTAAAIHVGLAALMALTAPFVDDPAAEIGNLSMVIMPAILAAYVFPPRWVVAVLTGTVGIAAWRLATSGMPERRIGTGFSILIVMSVAGALLLVIRRRAAMVERIRLQRLRESELALERASERLRLVLANSVDALLGTDRHGTVLFTGGAVEVTLGRPAGEVLGRPLLDTVAEPDRAAAQEAFSRAVQSPGEPVRVEWRQSRDGPARWIEALMTNHLDRPGVANVLVNLRDITARREADEARARLDAHLQDLARFELAGRMAGGVAHDFNNLLTIMTGHLELARTGDPARAAGHLAKADEAVRHATTLTRQLLMFARREVGQAGLIRPDLSLRSIEPALRQVAGPAIEFELDADPGAGVVRFDAGTFEWAVMNLAMNARDASPRGGRFTIRTGRINLPDPKAPRVDLPPGPYILLTAADTGEGMSEETRRRLFEPFFTTKSRRVGTGLALATINGAVIRAGGAITVDSAPGRGTAITIYLPRIGDPFEVPPDAAASPATGGPAGGETILYAEDNDQIREMTRDALVGLGYTVVAAPDGTAALAEAKRMPAPVHLLLTDLLMPGLNGRQLADAVAPLHPETRVLYTSGYTEDVLTGDDLSAGKLPFIGKPYRTPELAAKIREVLGRT